MELTYLITEAEILNGCDVGMEQLRNARDVNDLIQCYYDRIDYCLANNFPDNEFLLQYRDELRNAGVFIDEKISIENRDKLVLLGNSECNLTIGKWAVSRAYVKHNAKLLIKAEDSSIIMIDALDDAVITVEESGNARVIVNLYANSKCEALSGNPRIIQKNRFTYEL